MSALDQFDEETRSLLEIAQHFLTQYFGHSDEAARRIVDHFVDVHSARF